MRLFRSFLPLCLLVLAACGDELFPASFENFEDEVELGALFGTAPPIPSAYSIADARTVRTDLSASFDFAYVMDAAGKHFLVPIDALGLGSSSSNPGLLKSTDAFASITSAPSDGYVTSDSLEVAVGDVLVGRSRLACFLGVPQYAKIEVLAIDAPNKTIRLKVLANINCGYRSLSPGIPTS
jgi:hypothetical protein